MSIYARRRLSILLCTILFIALVVDGRAEAARRRSRHSGTPRTLWESGKILLTFDDSGSAAQVQRLLETLKENNVKAAFFPVGRWAAANPQLIESMRADGHILGNHSFSHANLARSSAGRIRHEISRGVQSNLFRPPYGASSRRVQTVASQMGYRLFFWSIDPKDWSRSVRSPRQLVDQVTRRLHPGAVVVMHMQGRHTAAALPDLISRIRASGYELELLAAPSPPPEPPPPPPPEPEPEPPAPIPSPSTSPSPSTVSSPSPTAAP